MNTTNNNLLQPLTMAAAPDASKLGLEGIQKAFGFIPNLMATLVMELLRGVSLKTISNYLDHISPAPLDAAFASEK